MNPVQMSKESATLPTHAGRASSALSMLGAPRTRLAAASLARHIQANFTCVRGSQKRERASERARREASGARSATQVRAWSWSADRSLKRAGGDFSSPVLVLQCAEHIHK